MSNRRKVKAPPMSEKVWKAYLEEKLGRPPTPAELAEHMRKFGVDPIAKSQETPNAYWNGMPTRATQGSAIVSDNGTFPQYWAKELVGERIPVVRVVLDGVNLDGGIEFIDDRDGSGWYKVTKGFGSPSFPHRNVEIEEGSFIPMALEGWALGND
jgi:hypothetical protein